MIFRHERTLDPETTEFKCIPKNEGFIALGTPIGSDAWVRNECARIIKGNLEELRDLETLEDAPQAYYLLL